MKMVRHKKWFERFWKSSFPPAAVMGALASFLEAASSRQSKSLADSKQDNSLVQISLSDQRTSSVSAQNHLDVEYSHEFVLRYGDSRKLFHHILAGVTVDSSDRIYVLGDGEVKIFDGTGNGIRNWKAPEGALCLTADSGERIYFGLAGRVEIYSNSGDRVGGFSAESGGRAANITSVKAYGSEIFIADANARCIRRYDSNGSLLGVIGIHGKNRGFLLPNRLLDMDVDTAGLVWAADPGRHRISSWKPDGTPVDYFGKFGQLHPEDFVGCCNPVNLALGPEGRIVAAEKVAGRIKVYNRQGKLLALIGSENFDPKCTYFPLAVDSKGRIIVADPIQLEVKVFAPVGEKFALN